MKKLLSVGMILIFAIGAMGQSFEDNLKKLMGKNAQGYVQPLVTGFGVAMNSGLYKKASPKTGLVPPFGIDFGVVLSAAVVPDSDMEYEYDLSVMKYKVDMSDLGIQGLGEIELGFDDLYNGTTGYTATIASDADGATVSHKDETSVYKALRAAMLEANVDLTDVNAADAQIRNVAADVYNGLTDFQFPGGLNLAAVPMAMPQANIRVPFGIELSLRGFPEYELEDIGKISIYGAGIRKSLPVPIVNVAVGAFYQTMKVGDIYEATNLNFNAEVGKSLGIPGFKISPYIGAAMDQTDVTLTYTVDFGDAPDDISLKMSGENKIRMNAGVTLQIPLIYINAEVAQVGDYKAGTVAAGFIFK